VNKKGKEKAESVHGIRASDLRTEWLLGNLDKLPTLDDTMLKRHELARALSISPRSVDNLQHRKVIPCIKISPRCVRFSLSSVLAALRKFEVKAVGE
jgi:hypothetical protein